MIIHNKSSARNYIIDEKLLQKYEKSVLYVNHFAAYDLLDALYYGNLDKIQDIREAQYR